MEGYVMKKLALVTLAAAALFVGVGTIGVSAMPMNNLSGIDVGVKPDQVRMVCNRWGRCWWRPNYYGGGYRYGYGHRHYRGGWRHRR
ncbi:MAG TPA: hypothetical protein VIK28_05775 [Sedimentisphaerales bacterium]